MLLDAQFGTHQAGIMGGLTIDGGAKDVRLVRFFSDASNRKLIHLAINFDAPLVARSYAQTYRFRQMRVPSRPEVWQR